ncbi:catechol 1,2-dioxygenase [Methylobacterium sp. J-072]|uniref:catechol 1,2-dioxygenase n=1 Tax=Methylobacterium sp. J-072 TaxID=2836651 RepID=UPI001FB8A35B|nr:catechol 1,2-dioxygenase [Methylobacterium sp. J-072]
MTTLTKSAEIEAFLDKIAGIDNDAGVGSRRTKEIVRKIVGDLFDTIDRFDVSENEFWHALNFVAGGAPEFGLWAAGLGFERFLDIRADIKDRAAGIPEGTPRTIEGPLYVAGAPLVESGARIDDGSDPAETLIMHGYVRDVAGHPIPGAIVDVWHANTKGNYSFFDPSQSDFNMRRRVKATQDGRYEFRSIVPSGYSVPPGGSTDLLLRAVGRHGIRPAHIHFFISAPGYRHLTTQINIEGDPYIFDDFAYATNENLIPHVVHQDDPAEIHAAGLNSPYADIAFDFTLPPAAKADDESLSTRQRALAG